LPLEILVAPVEIQFRDNLAAIGEKLFLEKFRQPLAVIALYVGENGDLFGMKRLGGEIRHDGPLEWINETNAENVITRLGDFRIGRGRGNHRNLALLANR